jgi:hypothetical protein
MEPTQQKSYGAVVASIIIILVLIVGALYFWGKTLEQRTLVAPQEESVSTTTITTDSLDSIEADLKDTQDLKDVEAGLKTI